MPASASLNVYSAGAAASNVVTSTLAVGIVTNTVGTSIGTGLALTTTAVASLVSATWQFTATGTGAYSLLKTPTGGVQVTIVTGLTTTTVYTQYIPGMSFTITGTLTSTDSATVVTSANSFLINSTTAWRFDRNAGTANPSVMVTWNRPGLVERVTINSDRTASLGGLFVVAFDNGAAMSAQLP